MIAIGYFTDVQFATINAGREALDLHLLEQNEILLIGRHLHASRSRDGYDIDDIVEQILSSLCEEALAHIDTFVCTPRIRMPGMMVMGTRLTTALSSK